jgi:5-hydroxyisourate hydrolase-like protein (transthyretin family)
MPPRIASCFVALFLTTAAALAATSGRVTSADGKALAGVEVTSARPTSPLDRMTGREPKPIAKTTTDAKGEFSVDTLGGVTALRFRADGYAPVDLELAADDAPGTVLLSPAAMLTGHVRAGGKPVAGARVIAASELSAFVTTTDVKGEYRMPDPKQWAQAIVVRHPDFAPATHPATARDFTLQPGRTITGHVVDGSGRPAAGVAVDVDFMQTATTGTDGAFTIAHAAEDSNRIRAVGSGGVAVAAASGGEAKLKLLPALRVRGVVRDDSKKPIAGATVQIGSESYADATVSDEEGAFAFAMTQGSEFSLAAQAGRTLAFEPLAVEPSVKDVVRDLIGKRRPSIAAIVSNADGTKAPGASVVVAARMRNGMEGMLPGVAVTDAGGNARVYPTFDESYTTKLIALVPALPPAISQPITSATREVRLMIPKGEAVTGIVKDAGGKPISGVQIEPVMGQSAMMEMMGRSGPAFTWASSGADGRFDGRLAEGTALLRFTREGFAAAQKSVVVSARSASVEVELARSVSISGRVVDDAGTPVPDVPVLIGSSLQMTDAEGAFTIDGLEKGAVSVRYGKRMIERTITAPASDVKLLVPRLRKVAGKVIDLKSGKAVEAFAVESMAGEERSHREAFNSAEGSFNVEVEPGAKLSVIAEGYVPVHDIVPSDDITLVPLGRGRTVRGTVLDDQKQPLSGVAISLTDHLSGPSEASPITSADGSYELSGIAPDADVDLSFSKEGFVDIARKVKGGSEDATLDVTMGRGVTVSGRVLHATGTAAPHVIVSATSAAHGASYASQATDETGAFRFTSLAPSRYEFSVSRTEDGERATIRDVDVEKIHEVTIRLEKMASGTIVGKIAGIDSAAGMAMVMAANTEGESQNAAADAAGVFRIENAPAGSVQVRAMIMTAGGGRWTKSETVEVRPGAEVTVELRFGRRLQLRGTVLRSGAPVEGVTVSLSGENSANAVSGAGGHYELQLDEGDYEVTARAGEKHLPFSKRVSIAADDTLDITLDDASVRATVIEAGSGQPMGGVKVTLSKRGETHSLGESVTDGDGSALIEATRGDTFTVIAGKSGYANASADVMAGDRTPVMLRLVRSGGSAIRIVDRRDGKTLSGYVIARDRSGRVVASSNDTDADGTSILPLAPGEYQISASAEGYGSHTIAAHVPGEGELRVPLPRGGTLAFKALNGIRGTARLLQPDGQEYVRCWCSGVAAIEIDSPMTLVDRIAPGSYTLELTPKNDKPRRMPVTVVEGQTVPVTIE